MSDKGIVSAGAMVSDQANRLAILPNFDAVLQSLWEDRIALWKPFDEGKSDAPTISKNEGLIRQRFDNKWVIQSFGVPERDR